MGNEWAKKVNFEGGKDIGNFNFVDATIDSYTSQIIDAQNKQMDEVIRRKLDIIKRDAMRLNDIEIFYILDKLDERNLDRTYEELTERGYRVEVDYNPKYDTVLEGDVLKYTVNLESVKVRIRKTVYEA